MEELLITKFNPQLVSAKIDSIATIYAPHINEHFQRWNGNSFLFNLWQRNVSLLKCFAEMRPYFIRKHFINGFNIENPRYLHDFSSLPVVSLNWYYNPNPLYYFRTNSAYEKRLPFYYFLFFPAFLLVFITALSFILRIKCK